MLPSDDELARFQALLLQVLYENQDPTAILRALQADPSSAPFKEWLQQMEPRMIEVGAHLLKKWGKVKCN